MTNSFNHGEKIVLITGGLALPLLLYFLYDDSLLSDRLKTSSRPRIGQVIPEKNDTRFKAAENFQWVQLRKPRPLSWGDGVFTGSSSKAKIEFDGGTQIQMGENSLVMFTPDRKDLTLDLRFGSVRGQLVGQDLKVQVEGQLLDLKGANAVIELEKRIGESMGLRVVAGEVNLAQKRMLAGEKVQLNKKGAAPSPTPKPSPTATPTPTPPPTPEPQTTNWISPDDQVFVLNRTPEGKIEKTTEATFIWEASGKASTYQLQIAKDAEFQNILSERLEQGFSSRFEFSEEGTYHLRVRALPSKEDEASALPPPVWSTPLRAQVKQGAIPRLAAPRLIDSEKSVDGVTQKTATLEWTPVQGAKDYQIDLGADPQLEKTWEPQFSEAPKLEFSPPHAGTIFYRVRARTSSGRTGLASASGQVRVSLPPPRLNPIESVSSLGKSPTDPPSQAELKMSWNAAQMAEGYEVQVSSSKDFDQPVTFNTRAAEGSLKVSKPGNYYVRVRSLNALSEPLTTYSPVEKFGYIYKVPLAKPEAREPADKISLFFQNTPSFWLRWTTVMKAESYQLELAADQGFKQILIRKETSTPRYRVQQDLPQGILYWRVRALNKERESHWSEARTLKVFNARQAQDKPQTGDEP